MTTQFRSDLHFALQQEIVLTASRIFFNECSANIFGACLHITVCL